MKHIKSLTYGLLLIIELVYSGVAFSAGHIILRDKNNFICSLPVPAHGTTVRYNFMQSGAPWAPHDCKEWNDRARTFQFAEVPSATVVGFSDSGQNCAGSDTYFYVLRTIKKQTSSPMIEFSYLKTFKDGAIIEPGLKLDYGYGPIDANDKLTCVSITTSAPPPSSTSTTTTP